MAEKYSKWSKNITTVYISRPSKIHPNLDFCFENKPSGNPDCLHPPHLCTVTYRRQEEELAQFGTLSVWPPPFIKSASLH
jgi:hypothetical protein